MTTVAEQFVHVLRQAGVSRIYGLVGEIAPGSSPDRTRRCAETAPSCAHFSATVICANRASTRS
jgi:hypothetical protein